MTTRNFRVKNGLSVGDITISASEGTITGLSTAAPSADGDTANKKYVDDSINAISTTSITTDSDATNVAVSGTGASGLITVTANSNTEMTVNDSGMQLGGSGARVNSILDEDAMGSDSATALATQQSIKAYVDAEDANIASDTLTFTNKTFDANGTGNSISNIEVADFASGVVDTDISAVSASDDTLASAKAIKTYVDNGLSSLSSTTITEGNSSVVVADSGTGSITLTADGNTELVVNDTSATFSGNVIVSGDLTVNGTTTTVATTNTTVSDSLVEYANGTTGTPANDAGIVIERGDSANAFIGFDESEDKFKVGTGTFTGASTGNLTITTGTLIANIEGNVTGNVTGNTSGSSGSCTGNSATATEATNVTVTANNSANETVYLTFVDGATGTQGIETDTGLSYNPSTNVLSTTASQAQYADVAERFEADAPMEIGSVVEVGGTAEITEATSEMSEDVFGVISDKPAYMMNAGAGDNTTHPFVAMTGRTPVRVIGEVTKGQRLVTSSTKGCARAVAQGESISPFNVIGRALESNTDAGIKLVNCAVRTNN
jgi:hypothetical protein